MKKTVNYFLAILMVLVFSQVHGQILGVKAGLGFATTTSSHAEYKGEGGLSYHGGLMAEFPFSEKLSLETGLYFSRKGDAEEVEFINISTTVREDYFYLNLPVMAKMRFPLNDMHLYAAAGPTLGYAVWANRVTKVEGDSEGKEISIGTEIGDDELKPLDLALSIGAGLDFGMLEVGLTYDLGLSDNTVTANDDFWRKNRELKLSVAYKFMVN